MPLPQSSAARRPQAPSSPVDSCRTPAWRRAARCRWGHLALSAALLQPRDEAPLFRRAHVPPAGDLIARPEAPEAEAVAAEHTNLVTGRGRWRSVVGLHRRVPFERR